MDIRADGLDKLAKVRVDVGYRRLGEKYYLYSLATGETSQLTGIGALIWRRLTAGQPPQQIASELSEEFSVPLPKVQQDTRKFIDDLYARGIVIEERQSLELRRSPEAKERWQPDVIPADVKSQRIPFRVDFETTYTCSLDCIYCYTPKKNGPLLSTGEIQLILDQLAQAGTLFLCFTGGEPFARRDLEELLLYAQARRFAIMVLSNATQITPARAALLARTSTVQVSLHGASAETHDAFTQRPGSFEHACRGIQYLAEAGANAYVIFNATNQNIRELDAVCRMCEEWQVGFHLNVHLLPNVDTGSLNSLQYRITDEDVRDLTRQGKLIRARTSCTAATTKARVSPFGDVFACEMLRQSFGNLREQTFAEIWQSADIEAFRTSGFFATPEPCLSCAWSKFCRRCPAIAEVEDQNVRGPSSEACRIARLITEVKRESDTPAIRLAVQA